MIKRRRMRLAGNVGRGGKARIKDPVEVCGRIILRWILENWDGVVSGFMWLRIRNNGGLL
jgi:hypothetical protein